MAMGSLMGRLSIQSKLTILLLVVATLSAWVVGLIAYDAGKSALTETVLTHLDAVRVTRGKEVETYLRLYRSQVQMLTDSEAVINCMKQFRSAFGELDKQNVTPEQEKALLDFYQNEQIPRLTQHADGDPIPEQMLPTSLAGRYLQYQYLVSNPHPPEEKYRLTDAGDSTTYNRVHAIQHSKIANLIEHQGYYDFILVDADTTNVVYSYRKEIDLGATLNDGMLSLTRLTQSIDKLRRGGDKRAFALVDFEPYRPSFGKPAAFVASPVFDGADMIGILVLQMPIDEINNLLTNYQDWRSAGLGETGEALLFGDDYLLRSESRFHMEAPAQLYEDLQNVGMSARDVARIKHFGTVILNEAIHTEAIERARLGESGMGQLLDYRGKPVLISYGPLDVEDLDWIVVAKMDIDEAYAAIHRLGRRLLVTVTGIGLLVCSLAVIASYHLLRPLERVMGGVHKVTEGCVDVEIPSTGNDEFGQLAGAFNRMTRTLRENKDFLHQKILQNEQLLVSTLPRPAIQRLKDGLRQSPDSFAAVSIMWAELHGLEGLSAGRSDEQGLSAYNELIEAVDELCELGGVEKLWSMAGTYVAVCGLSEERIDHLHRLAQHARDFLQLIERFNIQHESQLLVHIGLGSGSVVGSLTGRTKFSYELWGPTARCAQWLASLGPSGVIRLVPDTLERLHDVESLQGLLTVASDDHGARLHLNSSAA